MARRHHQSRFLSLLNVWFKTWEELLKACSEGKGIRAVFETCRFLTFSAEIIAVISSRQTQMPRESICPQFVRTPLQVGGREFAKKYPPGPSKFVYPRNEKSFFVFPPPPPPPQRRRFWTVTVRGFGACVWSPTSTGHPLAPAGWTSVGRLERIGPELRAVVLHFLGGPQPSPLAF